MDEPNQPLPEPLARGPEERAPQPPPGGRAAGPWSDAPRGPSAVGRGARRSLPFVLFGLTVLSTLFAGGDAAGSPYGLGELLTSGRALAHHLWLGVPFSATLLGILLSHELGHYFTARRWQVDASLPYFIPFPSLLGTLGAVIRMRGDIPNKRALVAIGASGPVAGFVVAVPTMLLGLGLSEVHPSPARAEGLPAQSLLGLLVRWLQDRPLSDAPVGVLLEGPSLAYLAAKRLMLGALPPGHDVFLHPVALAAWFGLFITALNLLPVGQLDGGHVLHAVLGERARRVGLWIIGLLAVLGIVAWPGWLLWALLAWKVIKPTHPPVHDPQEPLGFWHTALAWFALAMFVLTFVPVPMQTL